MTAVSFLPPVAHSCAASLLVISTRLLRSSRKASTVSAVHTCVTPAFWGVRKACFVARNRALAIGTPGRSNERCGKLDTDPSGRRGQRVLCQSGHVGNALRGGARQDRRHAMCS